MDSVSLAEPRRRQKWTLNPRGNLWANDESKFGQKLMEKMGWEKGKGLGAKGDGMTQHISLKLKDNNKGIGFDGHDDTWLAHQNDFQSVLAALNIEHGEAGKDLSETEKKANLEELSKKSRRRVHYQKFVRGKDTNNYSVEDLGCILGTKSEKVKSKSAPSSPKPDDNKQDEEEKEDKRFVSGGSYADYFAKKMAELKAKGKFSSVPTSSWTSTQSASCDNDDDNDVQRIGFSGTEETDQPIKKKKKSKKSEAETTENIVEEDEDNSEVVKKKKKKSKKRDASPVIDEVTESLNVPASSEENLQPEKKKKKKSRKEKPEVEVTVEEESPVVDEEIATKKKKSKKEKKDIEEVPITEEVVPQEKKKKSKKNKKVISEIENNEVPHPPETACEEGKKKKSKKSKKQKEVEETSPVEEDSGCENEDTKYKKAKKGKKEKTKEKKTTYSDEEKENRRKRKSESEENIAQSDKKLKIDDENQNDTKFAGFKGSNLLSITGYGV